MLSCLRVLNEYTRLWFPYFFHPTFLSNLPAYLFFKNYLKVYPTRLELFRKIFYPIRLFWVSSITCLDLIQSLKYVSKFVKTMWLISSNRFTDKLLSMLSFSQLEIAKTLWETSCGRTCLWSRLFWAFENTISNFSWKIICKKYIRQ